MRYNLIEFRKKLGLNQTEFGKLINLTKQKVCFMENGHREGTAKEWLKLQKIFNLTNEETVELMEVFEDEKLS